MFPARASRERCPDCGKQFTETTVDYPVLPGQLAPVDALTCGCAQPFISLESKIEARSRLEAQNGQRAA